MALATLAQAKAKLEIPTADTSRDAALQIVLDAASRRLLSLARYSEAGASDVTETRRNVTAGETVELAFRPVSNVTATGRLRGAAASSLDLDVLDATRGRVTILSWADSWPPSGIDDRRAWPVVTFTYDVAATASGMPHLTDAILALAAYWYDRHVAGAAADAQLGPVHKTLMTDAIPAWVAAEVADEITWTAAA